MESVLDLTIKELGFPTIEDFARFYTIEILENKLESYKKKIQEFEKKYGLNYNEFEKKHSSLNQYNIIEKEDDHFEWESLEHSYQSVKNKINSIRKEQKINAIDFRKKIEDYFRGV